ncbi:MAG: flavodoxin [Lachnospiraceae bacterium]|nr:flavodoxin [Lachnospiraceae bacterium]
MLDTFVQSYDFTDKTVIPFCTSASSGVGSSASGLESLARSGNWMDGKRFSGNESQDSVMEWVNGL